jgi:D-amino peptidase
VKVFISVDIEGCTGIVSFSQCEKPDGAHYDYPFARRMLTHDVNAAVRGAREAGADEIVIKDGHAYCKNLLIDELEPGVELISGIGGGKDGMMNGIDSTFDAAMLVGYHAMAGVAGGFMEHALAAGLHRFWINGEPAGEIAASAAVAGSYGVPLVMVCSDEAGVFEAQALLPGVAGYATKKGHAKYMGQVKHPSVTGPGIQAAARVGCAGRDKIALYKPAEPVSMKIEFHKVEEADMAATLEGISRLDGYTLEWKRDTFLAAHSFAYNVFTAAARGRMSSS